MFEWYVLQNPRFKMSEVFEALALAVFTLQMNFHKTLAQSVEAIGWFRA